jgi:hypothetical protein
LTAALLLSSSHSIAGELIGGKYQTVTESQCNFTLVLGANGHGTFTESCRREDGSHNDDLEMRKITWKVQGNVVTVIGLGLPTEVFTIHQSLSCQSFGGTGSAFGLRGYGSQEFWKVPRKCR